MKPRYILTPFGAVLKDGAASVMKQHLSTRMPVALTLLGIRAECDYVLRFVESAELRGAATAWLREIDRHLAEEEVECWGELIKRRGPLHETIRDAAARSTTLEHIAQKYDRLLSRDVCERPDWWSDCCHPPGSPPEHMVRRLVRRERIVFPKKPLGRPRKVVTPAPEAA